MSHGHVVFVAVFSPSETDENRLHELRIRYRSRDIFNEELAAQQEAVEARVRATNDVLSTTEVHPKDDSSVNHYEVVRSNVRSGRLIEAALNQAPESVANSISEIFIDYSDVDGIGGDGPLWSVILPWRRKLRVRLVASGSTYKSLSELFAVTRMGELTGSELCNGESGSAR